MKVKNLMKIRLFTLESVKPDDSRRTYLKKISVKVEFCNSNEHKYYKPATAASRDPLKPFLNQHESAIYRADH